MVFLFLWQPGVFSRLANSPTANPRKQMLAEALSFSSYSPQRGTWPQVCRVLLARDAVPLHPPGQCSSQSVVYRLKVEIFIRTPVLEYKANVQKGLESSDLSFTHTILLCCGVLFLLEIKCGDCSCKFSHLVTFCPGGFIDPRCS